MVNNNNPDGGRVFSREIYYPGSLSSGLVFSGYVLLAGVIPPKLW